MSTVGLRRTNSVRVFATLLLLTVLASACTSDGGTGTVWWGEDAQVAGANSLPIPYDLNVANHDRAFAALEIDPDPTAPLPSDARFDYLRQLRLAKQSPSLVAQGATIVAQLAARAPNDETALSAAIGYHELVVPAGHLTPGDGAASFGSRELTDRFGLTSPVLAASAEDSARAVVILIHGDASSPGYLSGQTVLPGGDPEYHRTPGPQWLEAGYDVFIPQMQGVTSDDFDEFGYSFMGLEASRIIDLATAIRTETDLPVVLVGLSRGAFAAELATFYDPAIAVTVSSGGSLRRAPMADSPAGNAGIFDLLLDRNFVISAATNDLYTRWTIAQAFAHLAALEDKFAAEGGSLQIVRFVAFHEMWAAGDISAVTQLLTGA